MLPLVKFLQPGMRLLWHGGTAPAEVVRLFHLAEKLDRIVHAINTELELLDVMSADADDRLLTGHERLFAGQREPGFGVGLLGGKRKVPDLKQREKQQQES